MVVKDTGTNGEVTTAVLMKGRAKWRHVEKNIWGTNEEGGHRVWGNGDNNKHKQGVVEKRMEVQKGGSEEVYESKDRIAQGNLESKSRVVETVGGGRKRRLGDSKGIQEPFWLARKRREHQR